MSFEEILRILQENRMLAGYVMVGLLFIILLIFLFIKSLSARKQVMMNASPATPTMKEGAYSPAFSLDDQATKDFLNHLKQVSNESQKIIEKLEVQIEQKRQQIEEKTAYMNELEQQLASMPMEQLITQHNEKLKKDYEKKVNALEVKYRAKSTQMWIVGFVAGLILMGLVIGIYYFVFLKSA